MKRDIESLREAHAEYETLTGIVRGITERHPYGLAIRPLFGQSRFRMTYCSQCGAELGPGNAGVSRCSDHHTWAAQRMRKAA